MTWDEPVLKTIIDSSGKPMPVTDEPMPVTDEPMPVTPPPYHVCFYNITHFGDFYFIQPFVKHVCDANPHITFYYWAVFGHAAYEGIPNLIHIEPISHVESSETIGNKNVTVYAMKYKNSHDKFYHFFYEPFPHTSKDFATFEYEGKSFIAFNTWLRAWLYDVNDIDYLFFLATFKQKMMLLDDIFGISLNFDIENHKMFPELPATPMTKQFSTWLTRNRHKTLVFIYNYKPRSMGDFMNIEQINAVIRDICISNPHLHVIVPRYDEAFDGIENITSCDRDFGFTESRTCLNLLQNEHILQYCRLVVTLPSGSTWTFMNRHISSYGDKTAFYLWGNYPEYAKKLNNWYKYGTGKTNPIIQCVGIDEVGALVRNYPYMK